MLMSGAVSAPAFKIPSLGMVILTGCSQSFLLPGTDMVNEDDCAEDGTVITIGQQGCQRAAPPLMEAVHLKDHLSLNPSEYSYFDNKLLSAWAGPGHWRIRPLSKGKTILTKMVSLYITSCDFYEEDCITINSFS